MNNRIQKSIQNGLNFLVSNQRQDGRFSGLVSTAPDKFSKVKINDNIFATTLILNGLVDIPNAHHICSRAASYLLAQRSDQWTWNYWERGSNSRPYPDDWDDTACAIAGIISYRPGLVPAAARATIAKSLIACEINTGGPYTTWLVSADDTQWRDVDIVVNANIGYMFSKIGVRSQELENYITDCIVDGGLESPYYLGKVPALYFIARWYSGEARQLLAERVLTELERPQSTLHKAMLITAAYRLGQGDQVKLKHVRALLDIQQDNGWVASALYYEPPQGDGTRRYAGSPELTTALVIEALQAYLDHCKAHASKSELDNRDEVVRIAHIIDHAAELKISKKVLNELDKANSSGWTAYTLYDDILDGDEQLNSLGSANEAMRRSLAHFRQALPNTPKFTVFAEQAFKRMDEANTWEMTQARNIANLPDYGDLTQLANRSWGQVIAPTGVLLAAGYLLNSPEVLGLHQFMKHYIIAKQLCDDAHDWQVDLERGRITAAVVMLVKDCPSEILEDRQRYFWEHTLIEINDVIRDHIQQAGSHLGANPAIVRPEGLQAWLSAIERSCVRAEMGRHAALEFIQEFSKGSLVK